MFGTRKVYTLPDYILRLRQDVDRIRDESETRRTISNATHMTMKAAAEELARLNSWPLDAVMAKAYQIRTIHSRT